jgi:putative flavoprotein involved in K+ transport
VTPASERYDVVVVGGGQAGLALGYFLARDGRRFTILEAADAPAAAWRKRWDSLKLFTPVRNDSLPGLAFPGDPDSYPGRDEVVDYLTRYAEHFNLPVQFSSEVLAVRAGDDGGFVVELRDRAYVADQVVIATGPFQMPRIPEIAEQLDADIVQMHSVEYRGPTDAPGDPVLVVGGGNTGYQIAEELAAAHEVHLAVGSRQTPLPQRLLGRDIFRYLEAGRFMRVTVRSRLGQRLQDRETLIGSSPRAARRRHGIELRGRAVEASGTEIRFADGSALAPKAVIWATGFALDHSFVQAPVFDESGHVVRVFDENGQVEHLRGVTAVPGLYFLGLPWQHTRGSALLGWVKDDAQYIASEIARAATRISEPPAIRTAA